MILDETCESFHRNLKQSNKVNRYWAKDKCFTQIFFLIISIIQIFLIKFLAIQHKTGLSDSESAPHGNVNGSFPSTYHKMTMAESRHVCWIGLYVAICWVNDVTINQIGHEKVNRNAFSFHLTLCLLLHSYYYKEYVSMIRESFRSIYYFFKIPNDKKIIRSYPTIL